MKQNHSVLQRLLPALLLLAVVLVNVLFFLLSERSPLRLDLTSSQQYTLTRETEEILEELREPVDIVVFSREEECVSEVREILSRYAAGDSLQITYVDPYTNPALVQYFQAKGLSIGEGSLVVQTERACRALSLYDLYTFSSDQTQVVSFDAEKQITSAILSVTDEEQHYAFFTQGHEEEITQALASVFTGSNYTTAGISLPVNGIPEETDIVVIASPVIDFTPEEVALLDDFLLTRGGSVVVFLQPVAGEMPILDSFLAEWGIRAEGAVVFAEKNYVAANPINVVAEFSSHAINSIFSEKPRYVIMPGVRPLSLLFSARGGITTTPVLSSGAASFAKAGISFVSAARESGDADGPFVLAATAAKSVSTESGTKTARLFVAGSKNMYADDIMATASYGNADFIGSAVGWCCDTEKLVNIPVKSVSAAPLAISSSGAMLLTVFFLGVMPLAILGAGIVVWRKRRKL